MEFYYHEIENDVLIISADGGLNKQTSGQFVEEVTGLIKGGIRKLIIDCEHLTYVTSYGLSVLLRLHKKMKAAGGDVKIANVHSKITDLLRIVHLDKIFDIYPDVNRARLEFREKDS